MPLYNLTKKGSNYNSTEIRHFSEFLFEAFDDLEASAFASVVHNEWPHAQFSEWLIKLEKIVPPEVSAGKLESQGSRTELWRRGD